MQRFLERLDGLNGSLSLFFGVSYGHFYWGGRSQP